MKKYSITAVIALLIGVAIFTGCQTREKKIEEAKSEVTEANKDLKEVLKDGKSEATEIANEEELKAFKAETELNIKNNDNRIDDLKMRMKKASKKMDNAYENRIDTLQMRNRELQRKMNAYNSSKTNWEAFKREFNEDMSNLGKALKDFNVDNKK